MNTSNPLLTADALLREGAALRALARRLLDDAAADDVVHDTYVAAMRAHAPQGSVGAWLGAIARRLALLARRRDARRTAREHHVASRTAVPSAADAAATAEWMQLVATAVAELPDAQRTVVVLRFWHDLPPRAIAARLDEPLNTISSRLHRALVQLRERLDSHRERGAWIAGLAAFAGGATVTTKANVLVGAAAAAVLAWIVWPAPAASLPPAALEVPAPRALAANDAPSLRDPAVAATSTVSGRCVTDSGAPVAGCRVGLIRMPGGSGERPHPQMTSTDASGHFTLGPVPAGARTGMAFLPGHLVAVEREWQTLPPGAVDVGDVCLPAGAQLVGMVRDAAGNGVGVMLDLRLDGAGARSEGFVPIAIVPVPSREDGVLVPSGGPLAPGQWRIAVCSPEHVLRSAGHFTVAPQQAKVELDVRVARLDEQPSIAGIAVSETGAPFSGLTLSTKDGSSAQTGADGAFTIHCRGALTVPQRLTIASQEQLALAAPEATYAWGSTGHRVVVRRPAGVWLHAVRADNGEPVTDYGVWLVPAASGEWPTGLRDNGHHEHGRVQLANVRAGRYRVIVQPADPTLMPSDAVDAELGSDVALRIEVEPARALLVDVRTAAGEPVAGSAVDLFRQEGDGELNAGLILDRELVYRTFRGPPSFPVLASARTDANGRAVLPAPRRGRLGLRVQGAHVPLIEHPLRAVADGEPLVLVVQRGATLRGTLSPASLLPALAPPESPQAIALADALATPAGGLPSILVRELGRGRRVFPVRALMVQPAQRVGDDGAFCIAGVPNGDWQLELQCGAGNGWYSHVLGTVEGLADGELRTVAYDIGGLAPAELRATVMLDGAPVSNGEVRLGNGTFRTDARGRVVAKMLPGKRRFCFAPPGIDTWVYADEPIVLGPGEVVERTVQLTRRRLVVRVLRADGSPAADATFGITLVGDVQTDGKGLLVLDPAPPWEFSLHPATADVFAGRQKSRRLGGPVRMPLDQREATLEVRLIE